MSAFLDRATWRLVLGDVLRGMHHVSHNTLALLGLCAVLTALFLAERPDMRRVAEQRVLGWLSARAATPQSLLAPVAAAVPNEMLLELAEPDAIARATAIDPADLSRQQAAMVNWISRRYRVAPEPISRLVQEAWAVGQKAGVEPTLILAIMAIESGFNPFAQSHVGAQGLMQVMTGIHQDKYEIFGGRRAAFDPVTNLRVGVQVLIECIERAGGLEEGLKYYVGAANLPDDGGYAGKVLAEQAYLREVVAGRKVAFNAPLLPQMVADGSAATAAVVRAATSAVPVDAAASAAGRDTGAAATSAPGSPLAPGHSPANAATPAAPAASEAHPVAEQVALAH